MKQTLFTLPAVDRIWATIATKVGFAFVTLLTDAKCSNINSGVCSAIFSKTCNVACAVDESDSKSSICGNNDSMALK